MLRNYLKITLRLFQKQKVYSLINVLGLAVGLAACIIIFLFVQNELEYDQYHSKKENIYRLLFKSPSSEKMMAIVPGKAKTLLDENIPEINKTVRFLTYNGSLRKGEKAFYEKDITFVDSTVFHVFSWPLISGDKSNVLTKPNSLVISQKAADKYFGDEDPIGQIIEYDNNYKMVVTGIMENIPENSHFRTDFFANISMLEKINPSSLDNWRNASAHYYLLLNKGSSPEATGEKIKKVFSPIEESRLMHSTDIYLQNLKKVHLQSKNVTWDIATHGDITNVYIFSLSAVFILFIACFNFMNLSTARSANRAKEVGLRKVLGADRKKLIRQFLGESFIYTIAGIILAAILVEIFLPAFNTAMSRELSFNPLNNMDLLVSLVGIILAVALVAGSYPAFVLSSFQPTKVLKGDVLRNIRNSKSRYQLRFRQVLVLAQFIICTGLIIGSALIWKQMKYINNKDIGFNKEYTVIVKNPLAKGMAERYDGMKNELRKSPSVMDVSGARAVPGAPMNNYADFTLTSDPNKTEHHLGYVVVDFNFFDLLDTEILEGRNFSAKNSLDSTQSVIINTAAAKAMGLKNPIGKKLKGFRDNKDRRIIGVVENIHYRSLRQKVTPTIFYPNKHSWPNFTMHLIIKLSTPNIQNAVGEIEQAWAGVAPEWPLNYQFLDQRMEQLYKTETQTAGMVELFTILAVLISFAGLYGLTFYLVESKTKEIGIRKVLGAKISGIVMMLSREILVLIAAANIVVWPLIFWLIDNWLQNFVYRIDISIMVFLLSGGFVMLLALSTIVFHTQKQSRMNPVDAIRYE